MKLFETRSIQRFVAICMIIATSLCFGNSKELISYAYTAQTGMITTEADWIDTKDAPSDQAARVNGLVHGKPVTVIDEVTGEDGLIWYQITYKLKNNHATIKTAYVHKYNVILDKDATVFATATVNADAVSLRDDAGNTGTITLTTLNKGACVELLNQTKVDSILWYRVRITVDGNKIIGWINSTYLTIDEYVFEPDMEFEEQLKVLGFPESYISGLLVLHAKYPSWQFVPVMTGLDWNEVIKNESKPSLNLVDITVDDAKKSVAASEYNWETNEWVIRDGTRWVTAHPDYLAYCMDPRNFMDEVNIFQFESLSYSPSHSLAGVQSILQNTFMAADVTDTDGTILNYATAFMEIGKLINVSPYHLASRVKQEQGIYGTSPLISGEYPGYEGYFNYYNINAYGTPESVIYSNGLGYARDKGWDSRYKSILGGASHLGASYINRGQDTLYFQKYNVVYKEQLYSHQYMQSVVSVRSEAAIVAKVYQDKSQPFVFRIPVYENMPKEAVTFTASGNRNNYLKDLKVSGLSLTPTFSGATTNYTIVVENGVSSVNVSAEPVVQKATVSGTGKYDLKVGNNTIKIYCKSESGETRTYTLTIVRQEPTEEEKPKYSWTSGKYKVAAYITGINPGTSATEFLSGVKGTGCVIKLLNADGTPNTGTVATGNKLAVYVNNTLVETKELVIYGDTNGDGSIDILDLIKVNRHSLGTGALKGAYLEAGDANRKGDGADILDIIVINRHSLGLTTITQ